MSASQLGAALGLPRRSEPSQEGRAAVAAAARNVEKARIFSGGSPQHPLGGFVAADDFADTRELVAVIRGSDGGRRTGSATSCLRCTSSAFELRSTASGSCIRGWNKVVVVAREDDSAMLSHAQIQSRRRDRA
jgi:hypothetical protein